MQIEFLGQGSGLMFMAKGCEIVNAPKRKGSGYCRALLSPAEAGADAEHPGWACLDALLQRLVHVPRGPNPEQIGFEMPP